jgi:hypothetical protein
LYAMENISWFTSKGVQRKKQKGVWDWRMLSF